MPVQGIPLPLLVFCMLSTSILGQVSNVPPLTGAGNNVASPTFGQAGTTYEFHFVGHDFADNISAPAGGQRPSARKVSEEIHSLQFQYGLHGINDLLPYFGQFICHDIALSPDDAALPLDIPVESCDEGFDSCCAGNRTVSFSRSQGSLSPNGYRVTYNGVTTWVDASTVYGSDAVWNNKLRATVDGLLKVSQGPHGDLLPLNDAIGLDMAPGSGHVNALFAAGDARANVNLPMVCLHTLFHLEHNAVARTLKTAHPTWSDQDLFDEARKYVVALMQYTLYYVYVPLLIGKSLPEYQGYDSSLDPSIDTVFMTSAFRYGHSTTNKEVLLFDSENLPVKTGHLDIGETIFNPSEVMNNGMDNILRGILFHSEAEADLNVPKQLRNHEILLDLAAKDIQRGRDRGLPSFNDVREQLGFARYSNWSELTDDTAAQQALGSTYASIDDLDALVGGLAEAPQGGALVSPTFVRLIELQFDRLRAADRFHFENPDIMDTDISEYARTRKLGGLVRDHTGFSDAPDNMFAMKEMSSAESCSSGSTGGSASEVHSVEVLPGLTFAWAVDLTNQEINIELSLAVASTGWIGIGFEAELMRGADVVLVHQPSVGTFQADDMHVPETGALAPVLDTESNIDNLRTSGSYIDGVLTVNFTRAFQTGDATDAVLDPSSPEVQLIFAYGASPGAYHGIGNRVAVSIDLFAGDTAVVGGGGGLNMMGVYAVHGAIMILMWMVCTPLSIMVARYKRHWAYSMEIHQTLSQAGTIGVVSFAVSAFVASNSTQLSIHALIGLGVVVILMLQLILGWSTRLLLVNSYKVSAIKKGKFWHKIVGIFLATLAIVNCFLGIQMLFGVDGWFLQLVCAGYLSALAAWAAYLELKKAKLSYKPARKTKQKNGNGRVEPYLLDDVGRELSIAGALMKNLPQMTFHQVTAKVSAGSLLIVINSKVYDIRQFINKHPGGRRTLEEFIGTDATSVFYGLVEDSHTHSAHALNMLDNYLIARLLTDEIEASRRGSLLPTVESKYNLFRFLKIIDKTELNQSKDIVVLYTLKWEGAEGTAPKEIQLGQHYRVLATYEGAGVSRYYTPLDTQFEGDIMQFAVKCYENGRMTSFLRKQPIGARIRVQGPYGKDLSNPLNTLPHGCYEQLVLFSGGSGITTHISIIKHHLRHAKGRCKIWLLFANSAVEDVFFVDLLKDLSLKFDGDLKVFIALSKSSGQVPANLQTFTVFAGRMDEAKLKQMEIPSGNATPREDGTKQRPLLAVCGPALFCQAIARLLVEHSGYNAEDIEQQY